MILLLRNRQRTRNVDLRQFRKIIQAALDNLEVAADSELCFHLVAAPEMTRVNETFLQHTGPTDVLTFDHSFGVPPSGGSGLGNRLKPELQTLHGEIFICVDEAVIQAKQFRATWQAEVVRYAIHGMLHLQGFDDHRAADRRALKREEDRLLGELGRRLPFSKLASRDIKRRA